MLGEYVTMGYDKQVDFVVPASGVHRLICLPDSHLVFCAPFSQKLGGNVPC